MIEVGSSSAAQTFTITNIGSGTLTIDPAISITGTDAAQFILSDTNTYPVYLTGGQSMTVDVTFSPTSQGNKYANLHIVDNLMANDVSLSGTGWDGYFGGCGNALDFDGTNDYANGTGISTSLTNITLEAWVYHRTLPASNERYVTVKGEVAVIRHNGSGQLHFYIKTDGTLRNIYANGALQSEKWHHVAGTWDGTTMKLYLNGKEVGTNTPGGTLDTPRRECRDQQFERSNGRLY